MFGGIGAGNNTFRVDSRTVSAPETAASSQLRTAL